MKIISVFFAIIIGLAGASIGQVNTAEVKNPFPAALQTFQIPSHGSLLNALVYVAEGEGPHPVVVLLHGFPGNERNLDLAQDIRRAGWDVLYFNYRGSWGSPGDFSFSHGIEDVASAVAYLRQPETAKLLRLDPKRVVLIGHSMGGFMTVQAAAADPTIMAAGLISAADLAARVPQPLPKENESAVIKGYAAALANEGMSPLAGCTPEGLAREIIDNVSRWSFVTKVESLKGRPILIITSDDGLATMGQSFAAGLVKAGNNRVTTTHFATDHSYSDKRLELS
ncbi:MAG: alpha/beta fold hydrolase, partial [Acidobacteriota bacterium]